MLTVRLPENLERDLNIRARTEKTAKSEIVKRAIQEYLENHRADKTPYELGADLFGSGGSGRSDLSRNYKQLLTESLHGKHAH
jgi:RHH-type transcriptional regulator, rel operon repressor / antitoxin RelB